MSINMAEKLCGYAGELLRVDLSNGNIMKEQLELNIANAFLGGRGLADYYLYQEVPVGVDPYSSQNRLIFSVGPLTGSKIPYSSRMAVVTKSPLTYGYTRSMAGGKFPASMKHAGFDGIIFQGKAPGPVYLCITDEDIELLDASSLWGKGVEETMNILKSQHGKSSSFALIGPAGENLVSFSGIMIDWRDAAARGGVGAVMGSKKLKGIVINSSKKYHAARQENVNTFVNNIVKIIRSTPEIQEFSINGTSETTEFVNELGALPTNNYQSGQFESIDNIGLEALKKYKTSKSTCYACPVACRKRYAVKTGRYQTDVFGPEYESIGMLGSNCGNSNIESIIHANFLCNDYSLDTISTGNVIAYAMECFEKGLLTKKEADGLELNFGNHEVIIELIHKIAKKEGIGRRLSEGVKKFSNDINEISFAAHVKGLEFPSYDPRALQGFGLAFAVGNRGACHNLFSMFKAELTSNETDRFSTKEKGKVLHKWALAFAIFDSACLCSFSRDIMKPELIAQAVSDCTGNNINVNNLMLAAERACTLERMFNLREGLNENDDTLPTRFTKEPMPDGPAKGHINRLEEMRKNCYTAMDWNAKGEPTSGLLKKLNLESYIG